MQPNRRYSKVPTRLDTGPNMRKILAQYENTSGPNARPKQQNEFYAKLKPLTLSKLLEPAMEQEESVYKLDKEDACSMVSSIVPSDAGTDILAKQEGNLLLLDVRSFDSYHECHLFGARHYDPVQLTKATNNFPRELYYYRGPMGGDKMVVLYGSVTHATHAHSSPNDPRTHALRPHSGVHALAASICASTLARVRVCPRSRPVACRVADHDGKGMQAIANTFVERGVENTFVLSGGLLGAAYRCPQLLVGQPPSEAAIISGLQLKASSQPRGLPGTGTGTGTGMVPGRPGSGMMPGTGMGRCSTAGSTRTQNTALSIAGSEASAAPWR